MTAPRRRRALRQPAPDTTPSPTWNERLCQRCRTRMIVITPDQKAHPTCDPAAAAEPLTATWPTLVPT